VASGYFWTSGISLVLYRWTLVILWIGGLWLFCGLVEFISESTRVFCLLCGRWNLISCLLVDSGYFVDWKFV